MTLTHAEARTKVAEYLDDESNTRWSTTKIDQALEHTVISVVSDCNHWGLPVFVEEANVTSSASDGTADLSSYSPLHIAGVSVKVTDGYYPVPAHDRDERDVLDLNARDCWVQLVRSPTLPTTTTYPLIQYANDNTGMGSDTELDTLACLRAAIDLSAQDAEPREDLRALARDLEERIQRRAKIPQARAFPRRRHWYSRFLRWNWEPRTQKIQFSQVAPS